jgi:2-keto-3-deoxy-L-rhamnonate aldolase RhmA
MFYERNKILTMVEQKKIPLGIQCFTGNTELVEVMGATGFDFVMFDCVHSGNDVRAMEELVRTATLAGMASYIRVPDAHNETDVRRALEAGAEGLVLREVHSVDDIKAAANAAYFLPKGDRRICPSTRSANYNFRRFVEFTERNNRAVTLVPEIENPDGVAHLEEICAHPDVRMLIFAQGNLAYKRGEGNAMDKGAQTAVDNQTVLRVAKKHNIAVIGGPVLTPTAEACRRALQDGVTVFCLGLDSMAFRSWCEDTVRALADGVEGVSEWTRPPVPESGFTDDQPAQSKAVPKLTRAG